MTDYSKKLSFAQNLANIARYATDTVDAAYGWQLPCTVVEVDAKDGFVTVNFEVERTSLPLPQITIPVMGWQWIRYPIQKGDAGVTMSIDTNTLYISGIIKGKTGMTPMGNLGSTLMFMPIMQQTMVDSPDKNATIIYGPNGVRIFDYDPKLTPEENTNAVIQVTPTQIDIKMKGGAEVKLSGNRVDINGTLYINGNAYVAHTHKNVQPGSGNSGGVN